MSFAGEVWKTLSAINVNEQTEKKGNLTYLSWSWAWGTLMQHYPESNYCFRVEPEEDGTVTVYCDLEVVRAHDPDGLPAGRFSREMWLPVMDHKNNAIKHPDARKISDSKMRCLTKCMAMFGLGHYIYAGEDLPTLGEAEEQATPQKVRADERAEGRADGPRYTPEEHAEFRLRLMSEDTDPAEFFCFMKQRTAEVQADLNSSWEYGKGTKMQAKTRDLEAEGQRHMTAIFDAFGVAMGTGDLSLVAETWTEFTNDQRQVMRRKLASDRELERFVDEAIDTIPADDLPAKQLEVVT